MELYIETLTGTAFELRVSPFETVMSVKAKIQRMEGIPISQQHLVWQSKELEDDCCLQDYQITDGSTIKLVLAMRGGPINTRRVAVEDPAWKEMIEYMEANRDEIWEKLPGGRQVTLLVFRDRDQINFFRVIDRGDGTVSPLAESLSGASIKSLNDEEQDAVLQERNVENDVTLQKMKMLRKKLDALSLKKKPKKSRIQNQSANRSCSRNSAHVLAIKSKIHNPGFSLNKHLRLPPVNSTQISTVFKPNSLSDDLELEIPNQSCYATSIEKSSVVDTSPDCTNNLLSIENRTSVQETGATPTLNNQLCLVKSNNGASHSNAASLPTMNAYRQSLMQLTANSAGDSESTKDVPASTNATVDPSFSLRKHKQCVTQSASGKNKCLANLPHKFDSLDVNNLQETLAKLDPRLAGPSTNIHSSRMPSANRRDSHSFSGARLPVLNQYDSKIDNLVRFRPKTSPEKWGKDSSDNINTQELSQATRHLCETLTRTRFKLRSQGSLMINSQDRIRQQRSRSIESDNILSQDQTKSKGGKAINGTGLMISQNMSTLDHHQHIFPVEEKPIAQELAIKNTQMHPLTSSHQGQINSSQKLPPVHISLAVTAARGSRCKICKKKTGLATSYTCRCGGNFCATHRYAETHNCSYDYKSEGRRILQQSNPVIAAPKLPKI